MTLPCLATATNHRRMLGMVDHRDRDRGTVDHNDRERGSISLLVIGLSTVLLLSIGLVYDGGTVLAARRDAIDTAEAAARAGATQVEPYGGGLQPDLARAEALRYLDTSGHHGEVFVEGRTLRVVVTVVPRQVFFPLLGASPTPVREQAEAEVRVG
jgi:uncharacterized membrane protein